MSSKIYLKPIIMSTNSHIHDLFINGSFTIEQIFIHKPKQKTIFVIN